MLALLKEKLSVDSYDSVWTSAAKEMSILSPKRLATFPSRRVGVQARKMPEYFTIESLSRYEYVSKTMRARGLEVFQLSISC